jgi:16S rRNA (adenine1518-N6/adenine1519-N6)-dimethyltransferase
MVLMFQKEVAERIVAGPGTKAYGRLSVLAQWRTAPRIVLSLPREAFTPPPKVTSAVVELVPHKAPSPPCTPQGLARVTAAAFGQRRKMLRSSLKQLVAEPEQLLEAAGIAGNLRAEDIPVKDFARLALVYERSRLRRA